MLKAIWEQFLMIAKNEVGTNVVETWLKAVSLYQWDSLQKIAYLQAPNSFVKEWIKANYVPMLQTNLSRLLNVEFIKIIFIENALAADKSLEGPKILPAQLYADSKIQKKHKLVKSSSAVRYQLNRNYLFDTFIVGPNNNMAYAAACAITQKLGKLYNPLFIYGGSGLGKTHLLHAIANELKINQPTVEVLYQPAERFVNEFIHAIRFDKVPQFQAKYKEVDVLLIDDVQCISNKEQTQEAFFHIFNSLHDAHKQIVFSGDSYPADMEGVAERLRSRLSWGLVTDVQAPTLETKIAILKRKAELHNEHLSDEVATFIASCGISNVRELEGAFIRVCAFATLTKQPITIDMARRVLAREKEQSIQAPVDFDRIVRAIQNFYNYTIHDLRSRNRSKQLSLARHLAMYYMKHLTNKSLQEIAVYLGRTDHSTVIHAVKQIQHKMSADSVFNDHLSRLQQEIIS